MRIAFNVDPRSDGKWNRLELAAVTAFKEGTKKVHPDYEVISVPRIEDPTKYDMIGTFGVKNKDIIHACQSNNVPFVYFDKAYNRDKKWWKISVNAHHPTQYFPYLVRDKGRRNSQGWVYKEWRKDTDKGHILLAGSSLKYHNLYKLLDPTAYWKQIVQEIRNYTDRKILYRPKKSWQDAVSIEGTEFSKADSIIDDLRDAHCMITHGSNSCFEAITEGIPAIVLGNGITALVSSRLITNQTILNPFKCSDDERDRVLNNLAYFQWRIDEIASGMFWPTVDACLDISKRSNSAE